MPGRLVLTRSDWQAMRRHVSRAAPLEACWLLAGKDGRVEMTLGVPNAAHSPVTFRMQPRAQLRAFQRIEAAGLELVGIYHSHPSGPDHPSATDLVEAAYPAAYLIWFREGQEWLVRGFTLGWDRFREISLQIAKIE